MRKLASVKRVAEIKPIPGADRICAYRVDGWWVVDQVDAHAVGDLVAYLEVDSWVPHTLAPFLSRGQEPREYQGVKGERLRTVKLRGQLSQGLIMPLPVWDRTYLGEGEDITAELGILKWEAPIPAQLAGDIEGPFPTAIPKTDQERIQNLTEELEGWKDNSALTWEVTEKLDGSSMTVFVNGEQQGVCSRNWSLKETEGNSLWRVARRESLLEKLRSTGRNLALQGEIIGEGIQGNRYAVHGQEFHAFDIYDIDRGQYMTPFERATFCTTHGIKHVPVIAESMVIQEFVQGLLTMAEGKSALNTKAEREGLVFKSTSASGPSFKAISNLFLLNEK